MLKVVKIVPGLDKNNQPFKTVTFEFIKETGNGTLVRTGQEGTRVLQPERKVGENLYKQHFAYTANVGDLFEGEIREFNTTPYKIGERKVQTISVVLVGNAEMQNSIYTANGILRSKGACVINEEGEITYPKALQLNTPVEVLAEDEDENEF